ncbi:hypothetical protein Tco_0998947 [Tanacetum coccineum]
MVDIGNVETSETLEVVNESTASAPNENDPDRGKMNTLEISETLKVEISETLEVKNDNAASSPASHLTKPTLTLLESERKNKNRSAARKTTTPNTTSEAPNASTSNRHRIKSWISLKEIVKRNENRRRNYLIKVKAGVKRLYAVGVLNGYRVDIYEDEDNARKEEIAALGGQNATGTNVFSAFYDRLKEASVLVSFIF